MKAVFICIALMGMSLVEAIGEEADNDITSPKLQNQNVFQYPLSAIYNDNLFKGDALTIVEIGAEGEVRDAICIQTSHTAFAEAALRGLEQARFTPAMKGGNPIPVRQPMKFKFSSTGVVSSISIMDDLQTLLSQGTNRGKGFTLTPLKQLDSPIKLEEKGKVYQPLDENEEPIHGKAVVTFYIGREGRVHMPAIKSTTDSRIQDAVFKSLEDCIFTIPRLNGQPVPVKIENYEFIIGEE